MEGELKSKIVSYADKAFFAAYSNSLRDTHEKIDALKRRLAARGALLTGATVKEIAKLQGDHVNTITRAKAEALLDAYELYGAEIDDSILLEARSIRWNFIDAISDRGSMLPPSVPAADMFRPLLISNTDTILDTLACDIEKRKLVPRLKPASVVQNIYQVHGANARLNLHSIDQSTNVVNPSGEQIKESVGE